MLGVKKIDVNEAGGRIVFNREPRINTEQLILMIQTDAHRYKFDGTDKLRFVQQFTETEEKFKTLLNLVPNPCEDDVPYGKDDSENVVMHTWGEKPEFDFKPLPHREILEKRGMLDSERATKISGSRFVFKLWFADVREWPTAAVTMPFLRV